MRRMEFYCDACGKRVERKDSLFCLELHECSIDKGETFQIQQGDLGDVCEECFTKIYAFINGKKQDLEKEDPEEEPEAKEEAPKKTRARKAQKRIQLDYGKMVALHRAGWTMNKIADEFGCSPNTIKAHMTKAYEAVTAKEEKGGTGKG